MTSGVARRAKRKRSARFGKSVRGERRDGKLACRHDRAEAADAVGVYLAYSDRKSASCADEAADAVGVYLAYSDRKSTPTPY